MSAASRTIQTSPMGNAEEEFLAKKMAEIEISPEIDELFDALRLTPEEAADERTRWILGLDRK